MRDTSSPTLASGEGMCFERMVRTPVRGMRPCMSHADYHIGTIADGLSKEKPPPRYRWGQDQAAIDASAIRCKHARIGGTTQPGVSLGWQCTNGMPWCSIREALPSGQWPVRRAQVLQIVFSRVTLRRFASLRRIFKAPEIGILGRSTAFFFDFFIITTAFCSGRILASCTKSKEEHSQFLYTTETSYYPHIGPIRFSVDFTQPKCRYRLFMRFCAIAFMLLEAIVWILF